MKNLDFGKKLAEVRKAKGLTQSELAERCSLDIRTIQRIELGEVAPRAFTIKAISEVLEFNFFEVSNISSEANKKSLRSKLKWYVTDLFNLKTNAMRKVSILATLCLVVGFAVFSAAQKADNQPQRGFKVVGYSADTASVPLFIVDEKEVSKAVFDSISPKNIESITVLKDQLALERYGEKGKNGVIVVSTKK